jgi:small-conductance mechanosensitive channel
MSSKSELVVFGSSLGDTVEKLLTASVVFLVFNAIVHIIYKFLHKMMRMDLLWAQFIRSFLQIVIVVVSLIILLGRQTVMTLVGGFSIGFGYAFQPVLLGAFNAIYLRSEDKFVGHRAKIAGVSGTVREAGLFHIRMEDDSGNTVYISNLKLTENVSLLRAPAMRSENLEKAPDAQLFRGMFRRA